MIKVSLEQEDIVENGLCQLWVNDEYVVVCKQPLWEIFDGLEIFKLIHKGEYVEVTENFLNNWLVRI